MRLAYWRAFIWLACVGIAVGCNDHREVGGRRSSAIVTDSASLASRIGAIEAAIEQSRRRLDVPGVAVAIVLDDRVVLLRGFGIRDQSGAAVTSATLFSLGSIAKPFTALAAVVSADAGVLSLEDSPKKFLPYFALRDLDADRHVTLRDLLTHRTGVPEDLPAGWF